MLMNKLKIHFKDEFYFKVFLKIVGMYFFVFSFMFVCFFWGNHDWRFLKDGVALKDGFFEARYSQHLISVVLFDGQVLPIFTLFFSLLFVVLMLFLAAIYLEIPKKQWTYLCFVLGIGFNPHLFVLLYYVFYALPCILWGVVGTLLLFLVSSSYSIIKYLLGVICWLLILWGYPPVIVFVFELFFIRVMFVLSQDISLFRNECQKGAFFLLQLISAGLCYKLFNHFFFASMQGDMYNVRTHSIMDLPVIFFKELHHSISQFFSFYPFMEYGYGILVVIGLLSAVITFIYQSRYKLFAVFLVMGLFLLSRIVFFIAENGYLAVNRIEYWGKLGILIFIFAVLYRVKSNMLKNMVLVWWCFICFVFIKTDFYVQKVWATGFRAERMYYARLSERLSLNENFDMNNNYLGLSFGQPHFYSRYYQGQFYDSELLGNLSLPSDLVSVLFWDDVKNPIGFTKGVWASQVWRNSPIHERFLNNPLNVAYMREWMYSKAQVYPNDNSIYVDDRYILMDLDKVYFAKNKEVVLGGIDK